MKRLLLLCSFILMALTASAQTGAVIHSEELTYNFGTIAEEAGLASHVFIVQNTGDKPLVIIGLPPHAAVPVRNGPKNL